MTGEVREVKYTPEPASASEPLTPAEIRSRILAAAGVTEPLDDATIAEIFMASAEEKQAIAAK